MLSRMEHVVKVSHDELGDLNRSNFWKLIPEKTLVANARWIINNGDKKGIRGGISNNNMSSTFRHNDRGNPADGLMLENDDASGEAVGEHDSPVPALRDFPVETI